MEITAEQLNKYLEDGKSIQVTTYTKSWIYTQEHTGWFSQKGKELYVQDGKGKNFLGTTDRLIVSMKLSK